LPRLRLAYAIYAFGFTLVSQASMIFLNECILTVAGRLFLTFMQAAGVRAATIVTTPTDPVFELALRIVEGEIRAFQCSHRLVIILRNVIDEQLVSRKTDVDRYGEMVVMLMVVPSHVDDDMA